MQTLSSKTLRFFVLVSLLLIVGGLFFLGRWFISDREDEGHYANRETEATFVNLVNEPLALVKAGETPGDTSVVADFDASGTWLAAGNYYLVSMVNESPACYPIPLTGYRSGPDADGKFAVTVRPLPQEFPPLLSSNELPYRYIPSGSFLIGDRLNPREPHYVWLTGYFVAPFEVTNAEFRRFVEATDGYGDDQNWTDFGRQWKVGNPVRATSTLSTKDVDLARFGQPDQPVTWVSWYEANAYCRWLARTVGKGRWLFSLPADAEWEKAARGPENFDYSHGMTLSDAAIKLYNWKKNPIDPEPVVGIAASIRRYSPNRYGLYHMTGNVAEWGQSEYRPYDRTTPYVDDDRNHDEGNARRSARGGSWYSATNASLYIPYRDAFQPGHRTQELGFRVVARLLP
jgi:formylglycine-generating enzyme required for sulfatase activity